MTLFAVVFAVVFFTGLAVMSRFAGKKFIDEPLKEARARRAPVAEFVDDLLRHRWIVIVVLAVLVALDRSWRFSGGLLQSRLGLGALITAIFVGRLLMRRTATASDSGGPSGPPP